jgi:peptidoglycan/xylan/chitin deacetylase (PgdA/CDA1 family)
MSKYLSIAAAVLFGLVAAHPSSDKRSLPVGQVIYSCTVPGVVALTFDDGPYDYTIDLLNKLEAAGHRATFFLNGDNYGYIYDYNTTLQRQVAGGHQICSHTLVVNSDRTLNTHKL